MTPRARDDGSEKSKTMSATLFTLREVNDASFPDHAMSGHLAALLRSKRALPKLRVKLT